MVIGFLQCKIVVAGGEGELLVGEVGAAPSPVATHCSDVSRTNKYSHGTYSYISLRNERWNSGQ